MRIFARFALLGPRCFSFFHRHFAATDWPEKLPFLFLGYTPNPFQVFFNTALDSNSTPRRFHSGTLSFCLEILLPNATLEKLLLKNNFLKMVPLVFGKAFEKSLCWVTQRRSTVLLHDVFLRKILLDSHALCVEKVSLLKISLLFKRSLSPVGGSQAPLKALSSEKKADPCWEKQIQSAVLGNCHIPLLVESPVPLTSGLCEAAVEDFVDVLYLLSSPLL